jgi:hypothetical protein
MKSGAENRKKTIIAGVAGMAALICLFYIYNTLFGGSDTPPPTTSTPVAATAPASSSSSETAKPSMPGGGNAPGVAAVKLASTSSSLDPTLDEAAMLRTEGLVYSGTGRNIFSTTYTPPPAEVIKPKFNPRPVVLPPPVPTGPPPIPPPPPINLKFFGTAQHGKGGKIQAFLLQGEDVYLAQEGDIVARKYKIVTISANSIQVTDLQNNNTQTLPRQMN